MSGDKQTKGHFVNVDESDPFEEISLVVEVEGGGRFTVGSLDAEPGRYELTETEK